MTVLFAAGDVGGARALLPVMQLCAEKRLPFLLLDHGYLPQEAPEAWARVHDAFAKNQEAMHDFFKGHGIDRLVFASSVHDRLPLRIARAAKKLGIQVIHVLDNWSGYRRRLEMDGCPTLIPDVYTVMDEYALQGAMRDGVEASVLTVTGQPALATLAEQVRTLSTDALGEKRSRLGFNPQHLLLVFVSEPVAQDQGASPVTPSYRGYTEKDVLQLFCRHLQPFADRLEVALLAHPRQSHADLSGLWLSCRGALQGGLLTAMPGREAVWLADGIVGMASILLYEAWLLGKPVLSLQPDLRQDALRMLQQRQGVVFVDTYEGAEKTISGWLETMQPRRKNTPHINLDLHSAAPEKIMTLLVESKRTSG